MNYSTKYSEFNIQAINKYRDFNLLKEYFSTSKLFKFLITIGLYEKIYKFKKSINLEINLSRFEYFFTNIELFNMLNEQFKMFEKNILNIENNTSKFKILIITINKSYINNFGIENIPIQKNYLTSFITTKIDNKKVGYFILCAIHSLFRLFSDMRIIKKILI